VTECRHTGEQKPKREVFSPTGYRTFSESYRSRFSSGVMEAYYLLSTFGKRESASICQRFIQIATFRLRIRLNGIFLGQNVFGDATSGIRIRYDGDSRGQSVFEDAALTSLIRLSDISLRSSSFNGSTLESLMSCNNVIPYGITFKLLH
jgi:hypothetical protein